MVSFKEPLYRNVVLLAHVVNVGGSACADDANLSLRCVLVGVSAVRASVALTN